MKKLILLLAVALLAFPILGSEEAPVLRGAPVAPDAPAIPLGDVLAQPAAYADKQIVVEGVIAASCSEKGCWMQLVPSDGEGMVRVTFKDYGFFIPLNAKGMKARAEGVTVVRTLTKAHADHLEEEGAKLQRNDDGSVTEISFVASGVELTK
jgi:hypothetical protein